MITGSNSVQAAARDARSYGFAYLKGDRNLSLVTGITAEKAEQETNREDFICCETSFLLAEYQYPTELGHL